MKHSKVESILIRYIITVILGIFIQVFYIIFTPLTVYPVYYLLKIIYPASVLVGNKLIISTATIILIPACIAGSAYYLLLILNLLTPIPLKTRIRALFFAFLALLILNIIRIFTFSLLYLKNFNYFNFTHMFFWYVLSIALVFVIYIAEIKIYKIKNIPAYTDIKYLLNLRKSKNK